MSLRIATYNVRKGVGLDWRRRPDRCLDALAEIKADIVLMQEVDKRLGDRPSAFSEREIEERTGLRPLDVSRNDVSLGWHGNAVLVSDAIRCTAIERVALPGIEPRGAVLVQLEHGNHAFAVVGVHLGLRRACRLDQLAAIYKQLHDLGDPDAIIAGDVNEWRRGPASLPHGEGWTHVSPGLTFHASRPVAELDRFFLSKRVSLVGKGVARGGAARIASDHLPAWVDIDLS